MNSCEWSVLKNKNTFFCKHTRQTRIRFKYSQKNMENRFLSSGSKPENRFSSKSLKKAKARKLPAAVLLSVFAGNVIFIIGLVFTLLGLIFFFVFGAAVSFKDFSLSEDDPMVEAEVLEIKETNYYENDEQVYEYVYRYTAPNGKTYTNTNYSTEYLDYPEGKIKVRCSMKKPDVSRIPGMSNGQFGLWVLFLVGTFPLVGLLILFFSFRRALKRRDILKYGELTRGVFQKREATNTTINEQRVYKMFFRFTAHDGKEYTTFDKTHLTHKLTDEPEEYLVYNPKNPEEAVLLDTLSPSVKRFFLKHKK